MTCFRIPRPSLDLHFVQIYASLDDAACVSGTSALTSLLSACCPAGMVHCDVTANCTVSEMLFVPRSLPPCAVCFAAMDQAPENIDRTKVKQCVSTVIASYWGRVMAKAWMDSSCTNTQPLQCKICCVDEFGNALAGCDCATWQSKCKKAVSARTQAVAEAWVKSSIATNTASCNTTVTEKVRGIAQQVTVTSGPAVRSCFPCLSSHAAVLRFCMRLACPAFLRHPCSRRRRRYTLLGRCFVLHLTAMLSLGMQDWSNNNQISLSQNTTVQCTADAIVSSQAAADASSVSAKASKAFMLETCALRLDDLPLETAVQNMSTAIATVRWPTRMLPTRSCAMRALLHSRRTCAFCVSQCAFIVLLIISSRRLQVYNEAYAACNVKQGTDDTGYGCAVAQSFGSALAEFWAQATADAFATISTRKCTCDLSAYAHADAWAGEYARIFAFVQQQVEAWACTTTANLSPASNIQRKCVVNTAATALAKARRLLCFPVLQQLWVLLVERRIATVSHVSSAICPADS